MYGSFGFLGTVQPVNPVTWCPVQMPGSMSGSGLKTLNDPWHNTITFECGKTKSNHLYIS